MKLEGMFYRYKGQIGKYKKINEGKERKIC